MGLIRGVEIVKDQRNKKCGADKGLNILESSLKEVMY